MEKFGEHHYVPVLYTKAGERGALKEMDDGDKKKLTPLFVLPPIPLDPDDASPLKTVDEYLRKCPRSIASDWGLLPAFIDGYHLMDEVMGDGRSAIEWVIDESQKLGLSLVPVASPHHSPGYLAAVRRILGRDDSEGEVCLRLQAHEWPQLATGAIHTFLTDLGSREEVTHLVLDLGDDTSSTAVIALSSTLSSLLNPWQWKTITVTATAMPATMPTTGPGIDVIDRQEWNSYTSMVTAKNYGARQPTFGDYTVVHPEPLGDVDPRVLSIRAKIKYTADTTWVVSKGLLFKGPRGSGVGGEAIWPAAQALVTRTEYSPSHCGAEAWIDSAAASASTGNPTTWVKIGIRHHIQWVLGQV